MANKYRAKKTVVDGIVFASRAEALRYGGLRLMQIGGIISGLVLQPVFELAPAVKIQGRWRPPLRYIADFQYMQNGRTVTEDVKGVITDSYRIKRHLMATVHGIEIYETNGN